MGMIFPAFSQAKSPSRNPFIKYTVGSYRRSFWGCSGRIHKTGWLCPYPLHKDTRTDRTIRHSTPLLIPITITLLSSHGSAALIPFAPCLSALSKHQHIPVVSAYPCIRFSYSPSAENFTARTPASSHSVHSFGPGFRLLDN